MRGLHGSLFVLIVLVLAPFPAQGQDRCVRDALGDVHCSRDTQGVAVLDNLGVARCAAGRCVRVEDAWHCSTESGGDARREPSGPVCDGSCAHPKSTDCLHEPD